MRISSFALCLAFAGCLLGLAGSGGVRADDTEVYQAVFEADKEMGRPNVLVVFDDSFSMSTLLEVKAGYDPEAHYPHTHDPERIYWIDQNNKEGSFPAAGNLCAESIAALAQQGYFDTKARRWKETAVAGEPDLVASAGWVELKENDQNDLVVDCEVDVVNANPLNGAVQGAGYPFLPPIVEQDDALLRDTTLKYSAPLPDDSNVNWGPGAYRFHTGHYMNWEHDPDPVLVNRKRLDIAKDVVTSLVGANTGVNFGLALFNSNNDDAHSGARIVKRILSDEDNPPTAEEREAHRNELIALMDEINHHGSTPLCESTYEAYRYLAGESVIFGNDWEVGIDAPEPDPEAEDPARPGHYLSPASRCAYSYIILLTDGQPTRDAAANEAIEDLTGKQCQSYNGEKSCLPDIAEYMSSTDLDGDDSNGNQYGITYTIGFATDQELLSDTATKGKGEYFTAENAKALTAAFQGAILGILSTDASFTSPSVAVDSFSRTQSRGEVFFAMFKPAETIDWRGNIKKLQVSINDGVATLLDKNGRPAINQVNGKIATRASTFWSDDDGGRVEEGGVGALLVNRDPATRAIKTNTGVNGVLEIYSSENLDAQAYGFDESAPEDPDAALFELFGVSDQAELDSLINWGRGHSIDEDDGGIDGTRPWILGDMLHSRPLVVNYGALGLFDPNEPDQRIVVGTNAGFLHMFGNDDGEEDWAFFPKELAPVLSRRQANPTSPDNVYGIDASPVLYRQDVNRDGTIDFADGDRAYIYFGLRRGGRLLYALDISRPDAPAFLWQIDSSTSGFSGIGQTWSVPLVTFIPGYVDAEGIPKPVLAFGAGYDPSKDAKGLATPDVVGRGIYIVDAVSGALVWSVTPSESSATNLKAARINHSVPGALTLVDSNGDELTDRIYFGDTGGNLWRVDMPGNSLPTADQDSWQIVKIAAMNLGTKATDRRFFSAVDVVRTTFEGAGFDALLIGTGDRTNPNGTDVSNQFYMIRDLQTTPYFTAEPTAQECDPPDPVIDFRCRLPLKPGDLYNASSNLIQDGDAQEQIDAQAALAVAGGWRINLAAVGEKSLSRSVTVAGTAYFTTFSPDLVQANICEPEPGTARLYAVDLLTAGAVQDFDGDSSAQRSWIIGALVPDAPAPHFGSDGEIRLLLPPGSGGGDIPSNPLETGASVPKPYGSYWYREEF